MNSASRTLPLDRIRKEMLRIARGNLGSEQVKGVLVGDDVDLFGEPSLRITMVLNSAREVRIPEHALGRISIEALEFLVKNNDARYPYTHYATDKELAALSKAR